MSGERAVPSEYAGLGSEPRDVPATLHDIEVLASGLIAVADQLATLLRAVLTVGDALDVDLRELEADSAPVNRVRARLLALKGANASVEAILKSINDSKLAAITSQAQDAVQQAGPRPAADDLSYLQALYEQGRYARGNR